MNQNIMNGDKINQSITSKLERVHPCRDGFLVAVGIPSGTEHATPRRVEPSRTGRIWN